jgi:hypothetical protein
MTYEVTFTAHVPDGWTPEDIAAALEDAGLDPDPLRIKRVEIPPKWICRCGRETSLQIRGQNVCSNCFEASMLVSPVAERTAQ